MGDDKGDVNLDDDVRKTLRFEMAAAHLSYTFSHKDFTNAWLIPPASVAPYHAVYREETYQWDDYLRTTT